MTCIIDSESYSVLENNVDVHLMPCKIEYNGAAKVDKYFIPSISKQGEGIQDERRKLRRVASE